MEPARKCVILCILLCQFNYYALLNALQSNEDIYLEVVLNEIQEMWLQTYVKELFSVCRKHTLICGRRIMPGNLTIDSSYLLDTSFCCLLFTCFDSCEITNLHIKTRNISETRKYMKYVSCIDTYKYRDINSTEYDKRREQLFGYLLVSSCPENTTIEEKFLCEDTTDDELRPLLDTVPVTFVSNDVHFANKFCAACHDVNSNKVSHWDVKISCSEEEESLTLENVKSVIKRRNDCFLQYAPPRSIQKSTLNMCQLQIVRSCNETGRWKNYNKQVEDLCLDPLLEQIHIVKESSKSIRYKNVFCAICDGISIISHSECTFIQLPPRAHTDFSMILTFSNEAFVTTSTEPTCPLGYKFIPLIDKCMKTHCSAPMVTDILHNTCLPPLPPMNHEAIRLDLALKVTMNAMITLSLRDELETELTESLSVFDYTKCSLGFAYELETKKIQPPCDEVEELYEQVDVAYVYMHTRLTGTDHQKVIESSNQLPPGKNISVNSTEVTIQFSRYDADSGFVMNEKRLQQGFQCMENPYNKATIVQTPTTCSFLHEPARIYRANFMGCPSILLPLQLLDMQRNEFGLKLGRTGKYIPFGEFQSLNSTYVYVCQKTLLDTILESAAENFKHGFDILSFSLLFCISSAVVFH